MITYTLFSQIRTMIRRKHIVPVSSKEWRDIAGDSLTIVASIFVFFILKNTYEAPMDAVLQYQGKEIPDFSFYNFKTGKTESPELYKNKILILNIWATWCPPCRREMPELDRLYAEMQGQDVEIIAVSDEDPATIKKFLDKHPYHFNTGYFTHSNELISSINTRPVSILIKRGLVKDIVIGSRGYGFFRDWVR